VRLVPGAILQKQKRLQII